MQPEPSMTDEIILLILATGLVVIYLPLCIPFGFAVLAWIFEKLFKLVIKFLFYCYGAICIVSTLAVGMLVGLDFRGVWKSLWYGDKKKEK